MLMNESAAWKLERDADRVDWLTLDKPGTSTNVLSSSVLQELDGHLQALARDLPRALIVISAKKGGFVAAPISRNSRRSRTAKTVID